MEDKSILIQCDEMTKNMMGELQDDMIDSLSKVSKTMTSEVVEKIKPIEKKISELKKEIVDFIDDNDEFQDIIEELNGSMKSITKSIESTIESSIIKVINEQSKIMFEHNKLFNESLHKLMTNTQSIKDSFESSNNLINDELKKIDSKIDDIAFDKLEEKLAILGIKIVKDANKNKNEIFNKIENINTDKIEDKINNLDQKIESNFFTNKQLMSEKIKGISDKIDEKEILIKIIHSYENDISEKIKNIQEEVEWGNKSFFSRIFGKKRE